MSIRTKTLLIIGGIIVCIFCSITVMTARVLYSDAGALENNRLSNNLDRVYQAYTVMCDALSTKLLDWSVWDDTFDFIETGSQEFITTNLEDSSLENLKIDVMVFADTSGNIVYDKTHFTATKKSATTSAALLAEISTLTKELLKDPLVSEKKGLLLLPEGPVIFSLQTVFRSNGIGSPGGALMFGEYLSDAVIQTLSQTTKLEIELYRTDAPMPEHDGQMARDLQGGKQQAVYFHSSNEAAAYRFLPDVYGNNILLLDVIMPREFYLQSQKSIRIIVAGFIVAGAAFLLAIFITINKFVLSPVITLRRDVSAIGESGEMSGRVKVVSSRDEIAGLAGDINRTLASLEHTQVLLDQEKSHAREYLDTIPTFMVALNADATIKLINRKGCELLGYSETELIGKNWMDTCIPERQRNEVQTVLKKIMKGELEVVESFEGFVLTRDNRELRIFWHNNSIRDGESIVGIICAGEDITEKYKDNAALRESEERFRIVAKETGQMVYDYDIASGHIAWTGAVLLVTGYTPEEFTSVDIKRWEEMIHPDDRQAAFTALEEARKHHTPFFTTYRFIRKDGTYAEIEDHGAYIIRADGTPYRLLGAMADVTAAHKAAEQLKESEERFKKIFEYTPEAIYMYDFTGKFLDGNKKTEELTGFSRTELIGSSFLKLKLLKPESIAKAAKLLALNVLGQNTGPDEMTLIRRDGSECTIEVSSYLIEINGKKIVLGMARDVTRKKKLNTLFSVQRNLALKINSLTDIPSAAVAILQEIVKLGVIDSGGVYTIDSTTGELHLIGHRGLSEEFIAHTKHYTKDSPNARIVQSGKSLLLRAGESLPDHQGFQVKEGIKFIFVLPILHQEKPIAVLNLASHVSTSLDDETKIALETLAVQLGDTFARIFTSEQLAKQIKELENVNALMVGRELRMIELKKQIEELRLQVKT
jgi:PAS domain S-box-containing protein